MNLNKIILSLVLFLTQSMFSQEGIPVYSDYLSDNYYLIHPSMAGAANCAKLRLTVRQQWFGQDDAPALQTLSFNTSLGEKQQSGVGAIVFNDKNGYHSQKGAKVTYAHHLRFSSNATNLNMLSFGINVGVTQSQLDETAFDLNDFDPIITGIIGRSTFFNADFGASYNISNLYFHGTVKNAVFQSGSNDTGFKADNLRKYLLSVGYNFGDVKKISWEPSILFQVTDRTSEKNIDVNLKAYRDMKFGRLWGGLSYRRSFDGAQYLDGTKFVNQKLQYITPIVGLNYKKWMFAYTFSQDIGNIKFAQGGFHQITIGLDFNCKRPRYDCICPAVNY
jgi:type IX secretion system PorP/SprF family membrane protein